VILNCQLLELAAKLKEKKNNKPKKVKENPMSFVSSSTRL